MNNITEGSTYRYKEHRIETNNGVLKRDEGFFYAFVSMRVTTLWREHMNDYQLSSCEMTFLFWEAFIVIFFLRVYSAIRNGPERRHLLHHAVFTFHASVESSTAVLGRESCCQRSFDKRSPHCSCTQSRFDLTLPVAILRSVYRPVDVSVIWFKGFKDDCACTCRAFIFCYQCVTTFLFFGF